MMNHRIVVTAHGGPDVLKMVAEDLPEPQAGEVRLEVLAAGVSAYDAMLRRSGVLPGSPKVPYTPGEDIVGVVDKLGAGVSGLELGQRVAAFTLGDRGGYAAFLCRPADQLVPVPEGVDPAQAVCLIVNYLTAHLAMHGTGKVARGERILVHGAAGGVGTALLELGRLADLEMCGTASSAGQDTVLALGATPIDYRTEDFVERVRDLTGDGVDAAFDPIGGARHIWRSYRVLRAGGRLIWFGMAATKAKGPMVIPFTLATQLVLGVLPDGKQAPLMPDLGTHVSANDAWYRQTLTELMGLLAAGELRPVVAARIPLLEASRAHALLDQGGYAGKIVLIN